MPTQIIDGFKLNATTPIDSRMVTSGTVSRNNLAYKYDGLRVFDTVQKIPFVYIDGKWVQELEQSSQASGGGGTITAAGKKNYFAKFDTNGLTNSVVREASGGANTFVGINIPINSPIETQLHVGGVVKASSFCGNILGTFVNVGTLPLNRLCAPAVAGNYMLKYQNGAAVWGTMDSTATATTIENNTTNTSTFITFASGTTGAQTLNVSCCNTNTAMSANLATSQLLMSNTNGISTPPYSFIGTSNTGLYGNTAEVGISMAGNKRISATSNKLEISTGGSVNIDAGTNYVQVCKTATFTGTVNISGVTTITNKLVTNSFQIPTTNGTGKLLTSDATGNATWEAAVSLGVPVGTVIIFLLNGEWTNIPAGWKPCTYFSTISGVAPHTTGTAYKGELYMNGTYIEVPDMRERVIMGASNMKNTDIKGSHFPSLQANVTLNWGNLPPHKHRVSTSEYGDSTAPQWNNNDPNFPLPKGFGKCKVMATSTSTFKDVTNPNANGIPQGHTHTYSCTPAAGCGYDSGDHRQIDHEKSATTGAALITGQVTTTTTMDGWTDDGSAWLGGYTNMQKPFAIPHERKQLVVFIIKIDPTAAASTNGHYRIVEQD